MQKVIHFVHHDQIGGGTTVILQHLKHYAARYDTWVIHGGDGPLAQACREMGIHEISVSIDTKLKLPFGFISLIVWLRRLQPDLLILHGQWGGSLGSLAGSVTGVPRMIYIAHWVAFYTDWDVFRAIRNYIAEWIPVRLCHRTVLLCASNYYQYLLRHFPFEGKQVILSNMIDLGRVPEPPATETIRRQHGWQPDVVHVVCVSRLATQKRIDWLLQSWRIVQDRGVNARLWIVGGGELESEMHKLAHTLGLEKSCAFLGAQANGIEFLQAADIVAMSTLYETNSVVPMEAMACGRPVVANDSDGVRGTFTDGREGFLVPPADTAQFAERLLTLIGDPALRQKMGAQGKVRAQYYAADKVLDRYVALYDQELASVTRIS